MNDSKKLTSSVDAIEKECQVTNSINNFTQYSFKVGANLDEDEKGKIKPSIFFEYTISAIENHMVKHSNESDLSIMLELEFKHSMTEKEFEQKFNNAMASLVAQLDEIANAIEDPDTKAIEEWKKYISFIETTLGKLALKISAGIFGATVGFMAGIRLGAWLNTLPEVGAVLSIA